MPTIRATSGRTLLWAVADAGAVIETGYTLPGETTLTGEWRILHNSADEAEFLSQVADRAGTYNPLPAAGAWLVAGEIYGYRGNLVIVRQSHARTEHAPEDTPALFSVYREGEMGALDWVANERVEAGARRVYGGVVYQCRQAHVTQADWTPPATPALWAVVPDEPPTPVIPEWRSGEALTYDPANPARRTYQGRVYQLRQNPGINIWPPPTVPALWLDMGPV